MTSRTGELVGTIVVTLAVASLLTSTTAATAAVADDGGSKNASLHLRLKALIRKLPVAKEHRRGYDRDKFNLWIDADHDCQDTRDEVLAAESRTPTGACDVERGRWHSYYDDRTWTHASDVDIDHVVPLAEAWDSGASQWSPQTRERYANDLGDSRTLIAVTDNVNEAKGDSDISEWQPQYGDCRYLRDWVAIKTRWRLSVDHGESRYLRNAAKTCPNAQIKVTRAHIERHGGSGGGPHPTAIKIKGIYYNPPGDESQHPNAEWLAIVNRGHHRVRLDGWSLSDDTTETYYFDGVTIGAGKTIKIRSGNGHDTRTTLHAGWGSRWSNDGDTATLYLGSGARTDRCSYAGSDADYVQC